MKKSLYTLLCGIGLLSFFACPASETPEETEKAKTKCEINGAKKWDATKTGDARCMDKTAAEKAADEEAAKAKEESEKKPAEGAAAAAVVPAEGAAAAAPGAA